jgi:hypothetical protein
VLFTGLLKFNIKKTPDNTDESFWAGGSDRSSQVLDDPSVDFE